MKAAVRFLEPHIPKTKGAAFKGKMVLATVKGDVHDIGKNLVDIILSNNGYQVVNLGIKQPLENILKAAALHKPDAIGLSGLLVKSTAVMKENLEEMNKRKLPYNIVFETADVPGITGIVATAIGAQDINIDSVSHNRHENDNAEFAIATMPCKRAQVDRAIKDIQENHPGSLLSQPRVLPILV